PERCQQLPRPARVFGRDQFGGRKFVACAWRQVAEIAYGCRDHREAACVRYHYTSPPRLNTRPSPKAIRHMTAGKALNRTWSLLALFGLLAISILLAGCPSGPARVPTSTVDRAEAAVRSGDYAGAAALYERLAGQTSGDDADEFRLRAARAWLAAGRAADADRVLAAVSVGATQQHLLEQRMLRIQSAVAQGRGDEAWREVSGMQPPAAPTAAARYFETRQQVAIATGHLVDGIRAEQSRERLVPPGDVRVVRSELLTQLRAAADRGVSLTAPPGSD